MTKLEYYWVRIRHKAICKWHISRKEGDILVRVSQRCWRQRQIRDNNYD